MTKWTGRPVEVANLLNPAFCAVIIFESARAYQTELKISLPYSLSFLILPLVLHEMTRERLPRGTRTKMHSWIQGNPDIKIEFVERTKQMIPYTKECLLFGIQTEVFRLNDQTGSIDTFQQNLKRPIWKNETEAGTCVKKAALLGKWFALSGEPMTIFAMWGIQP